MAEVDRKGSRITVDLDKEEDALGLYAVMTNNPGSVSKEVFEKGQWLYSWFFGSVHKLAAAHGVESSVVTMSAETASSMPTVTKRGKKK